MIIGFSGVLVAAPLFVFSFQSVCLETEHTRRYYYNRSVVARIFTSSQKVTKEEKQITPHLTCSVSKTYN